MEIEVFADNITKKDSDLTNHRTACRGIVKKGDLYLMVHVKKMDLFTFPGGGLEENETLEECVTREVLEETGVNVKAIEKKITINEYFIESCWTTHYFICDYINSDSDVSLTEEEILLDLDVVWKTMDEIMDIFENHETAHEFGPNIHNREFLGFINSL